MNWPNISVNILISQKVSFDLCQHPKNLINPIKKFLQDILSTMFKLVKTFWYYINTLESFFCQDPKFYKKPIL